MLVWDAIDLSNRVSRNSVNTLEKKAIYCEIRAMFDISEEQIQFQSLMALFRRISSAKFSFITC